MMFLNVSDTDILKIKNADSCWIITGIGKIEAIKLLQNIDLTEKRVNIIKANTKGNFLAKFMSNSNLNEKIGKL